MNLLKHRFLSFIYWLLSFIISSILSYIFGTEIVYAKNLDELPELPDLASPREKNESVSYDKTPILVPEKHDLNKDSIVTGSSEDNKLKRKWIEEYDPTIYDQEPAEVSLAKIEELEKSLEEARVKFMRLVEASRGQS